MTTTAPRRLVRPTTALLTMLAMIGVLLVTPGTARAHDASCGSAPAVATTSTFASLLALIDVFGFFADGDQGESDACPDKFEDVVTKMHRDWEVAGEPTPAAGPGNANAPLTHAPCVNGMAADMFPCKGVDMMSHVSLAELGIERLNDIWGWTDSTTKKDYAIVGATTATVFVDITDSKRPKVLGMLPSAIGGSSSWRDIKVYADHAFIVSEHANHGMQVFDLTRLRDWDGSYTIYDADARYTGHGSAHNININPETGFAYSIGSRGFSSKGLPYSLVVDAPSSAAGSYLATGANFGPALDQTGLSGPIAAAVDTTGRTTACNPLVDFPAGSVALVDRGGCTFVLKVQNAQAAGATAVIVANNAPSGHVNMGGTAPDVTIPSIFVSQADGATIRAGLPAAGSMFANDPPSPCGTGLHMIDIRDPKNPTFAGCDDTTGYVHDTQCVVYRGPDADHRGKELCFNSNGYSVSTNPELNWLSIVDVTDKSNPVTLSMVQYEGSGYSHQAWLTDDQRFLLHGDEGDETLRGVGTTTRVWDVRDLDNPFVKSVFENTTGAIDHNLYTQGRYAYAANYTAGLRVYDMKSIATTGLTEAGFFDTFPENDDPSFGGGPWSNYPYFRQKGIVAVSSVDRGLFILRPHVGRSGN